MLTCWGGDLNSHQAFKGKPAKSVRPGEGENLLSTTSTSEVDAPTTVAEFFANPPSWLPGQLVQYRENPELHFKPLCAAVAAVVLEDGARGDEVREEVERELVRNLGESRTSLPAEVINIKSGEPYDIYIGRKMKRGRSHLECSDWHNPFKEGKDGTLEEVLQKYERYLREERPDLIDRLHELKSKTLACWCKPGPCHGDVLVRLVEELV